MRPPIELQNGASIDLSAMNEVWSVDGIAPAGLKSSQTYTQPGLVSFADGAVITIDIGARKASGLMVAWTTPPANLDTISFVAPPGVRYSVMVDEETGIYIRSGLCIYVR